MEQAGEVDYLITWRDNEFVGRVGRTRPSLASPSSAKRLRQATTLDGETPTS